MADRITPVLMEARDLDYPTALRFVNKNIHRKSESPYGGPGSTAKYMIDLWDEQKANDGQAC